MPTAAMAPEAPHAAEMDFTSAHTPPAPAALQKQRSYATQWRVQLEGAAGRP